MQYSVTAPLANFRSTAEAVLSTGFGDTVNLTEMGSPYIWGAPEGYDFLWQQDVEIFCLSMSETWQQWVDRDLNKPLRAMDEVVTAMRLLKPGGVWLPVIWAQEQTANGDDEDGEEGLTPRVLRMHLGGRWEACLPHIQQPPDQKYEPYELRTEDIKELQDVLDGLSRRPLDGRDSERSRIEIAINRFNMAFDRPRREDEVIDLSVALEALFVNLRETDIASHVSNRSATYLEESFQSIKELSGQVKRWYRVRSSIVHGGESPRDLSAVVGGLATVVRRSLRKALADPASLTLVREYLRRSAN